MTKAVGRTPPRCRSASRVASGSTMVAINSVSNPTRLLAIENGPLSGTMTVASGSRSFTRFAASRMTGAILKSRWIANRINEQSIALGKIWLTFQ